MSSGNAELDLLLEQMEVKEKTSTGNVDLDDLNKSLSEPYVSDERALLNNVFQERPEIVDYYFTQKSKDATFQLNKENLKQFNLEPKKLNFSSTSNFFKSIPESKNSDLDRFSNLTGTKNVYPLKNLDDQAGATSFYNIMRRNQKLSDQEYKASFTENLAIGSVEGVNRALLGAVKMVAEQYDIENNTEALSYIEDNWRTIDLEGSGVADFGRFMTQYGLPFGTALKIGNRIKAFKTLGNLKSTIPFGVGKTINMGGKFAYYGAAGIGTAYVLTQGEEDIPWYVTDSLGKQLGLEEETSLEDETELFGSEKATVAVRNRLKMAVNEGILSGGGALVIPAVLKGAYKFLFGNLKIGSTTGLQSKIPYLRGAEVNVPLLGPAVLAGLRQNLDALSMVLGKTYNGSKWGITKTGEIFSKITPEAIKKQSAWFQNAVAGKFPRYEDWRMFDWGSSNPAEKIKAGVLRSLEYVNSNGRYSPAGKYAKRLMENKIRGDGKGADALMTILERAAYKVANETNKFGQINSSLDREILYNNISKVLQNKPGFVWNNNKLFKTQEMRNAVKELYVALRNAKQGARKFDPKAFDEFYPNLKSYLNVSYKVQRARDKFKVSYGLKEEAAQWYYQATNRKISSIQASRVINDIIETVKSGNFSAKEIEKIVNTTLRRPTVLGKRKLLIDNKTYNKMLEKGESMPQMMNKILGKETDPRSIILNTLAEFSNVIHKNNMYKDFLRINAEEVAKGVGKGKPFLFKSQEEFSAFFPNAKDTILKQVEVLRNTSVPIADEMKEFLATPTFVKALYDDAIMIDDLTKYEFIRLMLIPKTIVSAFKTMGSQVTVARNFVTAATFPLVAGLMGTGDDMGRAMSFMLKEVANKGNIKPDDFAAFTKELSERGITDQSAIAGELQSLFAEIAEGGLDTAAKIGQKFIKNTVVKKLTDIYQGGDYIWRIWGYLTYQNTLKGIIRNADDAKIFTEQIWKRKINPLDNAGKPKDVTELIKEISAEMVSQQFPTYSRVPYITKSFRNFPLLGNFVSFQSEMLRTIPQNLLYSRRMINFTHPDKKVQELVNYQGWRILLGTSTATGIAGVLVGQGLKITGITSEIMNAFEESVAPPFAKSFNMPLTEQKEDGTFWSMNLNTMVPQIMYANIVKDLIGMVNGPEESWVERIDKGIFGTERTNLLGVEQDPGILDHMFGSMMTLPIYAEGMKEVILNKKTSGAPLWREDFDTWENGGKGDKIIAHLTDRMLPTTVDQIEKLSMSLNQDLDKDGYAVDRVQQYLKLGGVSIQKVDPVRSLPYKIGEYSRAISNTSAGFRSEVYNDINLTKQKSYDSYVKELIGRFKVLKKLQRDMSNFMVMGVSEEEILSQKKRDEMSILPSILYNEFTAREVKFSDPSLERLMEKKRILTPDAYVEDYVDFERIYDLIDKTNYIPLNDILFTEDDSEVQNGDKQVGDIKQKGTTLEEFINIIEGTGTGTGIEEEKFKEIDIDPTKSEYDLLLEQMSQQFPIVQPQTIAAAAPPPINQAINPATGLSATEEALLSPSEKAIRLRNKTRTVV